MICSIICHMIFMMSASLESDSIEKNMAHTMAPQCVGCKYNAHVMFVISYDECLSLVRAFSET